VASAGDVNGDGFDDLIIGADFADPNRIDRAGESYVVFGAASGFGASLDLSTLNGTNGFVINGIDAGDTSGRSVASAGDVNGDGFDDLIIGAQFADPNGNSYAGESYVIFGGATGTQDASPVSRAGTADPDNFTGNAGNDTFTNIGADDVVRGGAGDDSIAITATTFADISGGRGIDTLALAGSGLNLDLVRNPRPRLESIEVIDLTGTDNNSLTVSELAIYQLTEERSGGEATLIVRGNAGDSVTALGFIANGTQVVDGITYNRFEQGNANLLVESGVTVAPKTVVTTSNVTMMEGNSGATFFDFVFTRTGYLSHQVNFMVNIAGSGTNPATTGSDIISLGFDLFLPGEATTTVRVVVVGDIMSEPNETFALSLFGFSDPNVVNDPARGIATGTILNDDAPMSLSPDNGLAMTPRLGSDNGAVAFSPPSEMMMIESFAIV
jgi:hypothetical protein